MAETYKIKAVKPEPKQWSSQYGPMLTYTVLFEGREIPTEINKKQDSPAPKVGDEVFGDINRTEYGDKFKSQQKPFSGGGGGAKSFGGKPQADPYTMFLSYVKDIAVALVNTKTYTTDKLNEIATDVASTGEMFYAMRPDAKTSDEPKSDKLDTVVEPSEDLLKNIDDVFGKEKETPWVEPA